MDRFENTTIQADASTRPRDGVGGRGPYPVRRSQHGAGVPPARVTTSGPFPPRGVLLAKKPFQDHLIGVFRFHRAAADEARVPRSDASSQDRLLACTLPWSWRRNPVAGARRVVERSTTLLPSVCTGCPCRAKHCSDPSAVARSEREGAKVDSARPIKVCVAPPRADTRPCVAPRWAVGNTPRSAVVSQVLMREVAVRESLGSDHRRGSTVDHQASTATVHQTLTLCEAVRMWEWRAVRVIGQDAVGSGHAERKDSCVTDD